LARGRKKSAKSSMGNFLREQIIGTEQPTEIKISDREVHIMTRLSEDIVEILDALVDLNVFKSRSEAVAAYVESSIIAKQELYLKVLEQFKEVEDKRGEAMETVLDAFEKLEK
jgi:Arc/MetJ-type ribon-helix-helix transcriptional regulator